MSMTHILMGEMSTFLLGGRNIVLERLLFESSLIFLA